MGRIFPPRPASLARVDCDPCSYDRYPATNDETPCIMIIPRHIVVLAVNYSQCFGTRSCMPAPSSCRSCSLPQVFSRWLPSRKSQIPIPRALSHGAKTLRYAHPTLAASPRRLTTASRDLAIHSFGIPSCSQWRAGMQLGRSYWSEL